MPENLEAATFHLFHELGSDKNIYMTRDWLDFSVEHLSHYFRKHVDTDVFANFEIAIQMMKRFLNKVKIRFPNGDDSAFNATLAVIPHFSPKSNFSFKNWTLHGVSTERPRKQKYLYMFAMSATLTSLWQAGIRRVVVAFPDDYQHYPGSYIPAFGNFSVFIDLDVQGGDSCCDRGIWPGDDDFPFCGDWWYRCGYVEEDVELSLEERYHRHERLFAYPTMRITSGMNVMVVQEQGRLCWPKKGGNCNDNEWGNDEISLPNS